MFHEDIFSILGSYLHDSEAVNLFLTNKSYYWKNCTKSIITTTSSQEKKRIKTSQLQLKTFVTNVYWIKTNILTSWNNSTFEFTHNSHSLPWYFHICIEKAYLSIIPYPDNDHTLPIDLCDLHLLNIHELSTVTNFNTPLLCSVIAPSIQSIIFSKYFNRSITNGCLVHSSLKEIQFGDMFNQPLEEEGRKWGSIVNIFPPTLTSLSFGRDFNQPIPVGCLPEKLDVLYFGEKFNQKLIVNTLPTSLCLLQFGSQYNQTFDPEVLPPNLNLLELGQYYNQKLDNLPLNLQRLVLYDYQFRTLSDAVDFFMIPSSVHTLVMICKNYFFDMMKKFKLLYIKKLYLVTVRYTFQLSKIQSESLECIYVPSFDDANEITSDIEIKQWIEIPYRKIKELHPQDDFEIRYNRQKKNVEVLVSHPCFVSPLKEEKKRNWGLPYI